jgi:outer membrane protein assembly factor BamD
MDHKNCVLTFVFMGMLAVFLSGGCSSGWFARKEPPKTVGELMELGEDHYDERRYEQASAVFQRVKDRYPYSSHAPIAELRLADVHYDRQEFEDAYLAYDEFERLHPKNERIPYVMYRKGMCAFEQVTTMDREQTHVFQARREFERLIRRFPEDAYSIKARNHLRQCLIYLSEYELSVAHFYFKMGKYRPALDRYTNLIENYPDMGHHHEALEYIGKCNEMIAQGPPPEEGILGKLWPF